MNWESLDLSPEEDKEYASSRVNTQNSNTIHEQNEQQNSIQLKKFQKNSNEDHHKKAYIATMSQFGKLIITNSKEEIVQSLLAEDCEIFLFNFVNISPAQFAFRHEGFFKLFKDIKLLRREVKETYISLQKATGFQICNCEILDESKGSIVSQFSFEAFSFADDKIRKYRASYGYMPEYYQPEKLFIPSRKETMLAKIKELNHAWAGKPNFERIASLLPESAEYKVWRCKDNKCFTFSRTNFACDFKRCFEDDYVIKSIVPYDAYCEAQYVIGSYVYYLEGNGDLNGQKFMWVSTCIYTFDQDVNIKKINQQGELYSEDEILIPFQAYSREKLAEKANELTKCSEDHMALLATGEVNFAFDLNVFGNSNTFFSGQVKGLSQFDQLAKIVFKVEEQLEDFIFVDTFEDLDDSVYDSIILIECSRGVMNMENCAYNGKLINFYNIVMFSFENGKLAKVVLFPGPIPHAIPSPYDDVNFTSLNIRPKSEFV